MQRPKKSELSEWQLSTRKNFPDDMRKSFLRQKKACTYFCDEKSTQNCNLMFKLSPFYGVITILHASPKSVKE